MYRSRAIGELSTTADHLPDLRERLQPERVFPQEGLRHPLAQLHQRQVRKKCQTEGYFIYTQSVVTASGSGQGSINAYKYESRLIVFKTYR